MNKPENDTRKSRIFGGITYLVTFALWMCAMDFDGVGEFIVACIISVVLAVFTFHFVGIGLKLLLVPVHVLINVLRNIGGKGDNNDPPQV